MSFRRPFTRLISRAFWLAALLFAAGVARGQNVIFHLRNGDRIAGVILSERTNQVVISNIWTKELAIPLAQVTFCQIPTNAPFIGTNFFYGTNLALAGKVINTNTFWKRWKGDASIGMGLERGGVNSQLFYGKANLTYAQPLARDPKQFFKNILTYDAEYGSTSGVLSDNRMGGSSKTDYDLTRRYYVYNLGAAFYDDIRQISLHYEEGPGVGYHWFNQTNFIVNLELGAAYQYEARFDETHVRAAYYRLAEDLTWKVNKQVNFTQKFEYFPRVGYATQYRMRFDSTLSYALLAYLSLNLSVADYYDTQPSVGVPNNDLQVRTSLGVKF